MSQLTLASVLSLAYYFPSLEIAKRKLTRQVDEPLINVWMYFLHFCLLLSAALWIYSYGMGVMNLLIGTLLCISGVAFHFEAIRKLDEHYSRHVDYRRGKRLIKGGIFSVVRFPLYTGALLFFLGLAAMALSWPVLALYCFMLYYVFVKVRKEDAELRKRFGNEYRIYRISTPAVIPRMRR